tara:strand:+ start:266 stop:616 length:351 start_codon:yes stop_codon:yes gene_type:complete
MTALQELLAKVEAGDCNGVSDAVQGMYPNDIGFSLTPEALTILNAYNGSLDAAKKLHDAVLPDWHFNISSEANGNGYVVALTDAYWIDRSLGCAINPARTWLIAIIKALIAKEQST